MDVEVTIREIQTLLDEEDKQEKEFQVVMLLELYRYSLKCISFHVLSLLVENNENIYYEHLVLFNTVGMVSGVTSFLSYKSCFISVKKFFCGKTFLGASLTVENLGSETKAL